MRSGSQVSQPDLSYDLPLFVCVAFKVFSDKFKSFLCLTLFNLYAHSVRTDTPQPLTPYSSSIYTMCEEVYDKGLYKSHKFATG